MFSTKSLKQSIGWIILTVGIAAYIIGYSTSDEYKFTSEILIKLADVLIIGVVVGYLSSVAQWSGIFKKELQDIIYAKEFIGKRTDIETIWHNVTKQMFKYKFHSIHKELLDTLKLILPDDKTGSYYDDYDADIRVEWYDKENGIIQCIETMVFNLITESTDKIEYPIRTRTIIDPSKRADYDRLNNGPEIEVNGDKPRIKSSNSSLDDNNLTNETIIELEGSTKYSIKYTRVKIYDVNIDYYIAMKSKYIINDMHVAIELPEGLEGLFLERGTNQDFEIVKNTKQNIKLRYKGIIFPKQGYIFVLRKTI